MNMSNDDRRRFFRITDAIGVSYTLVADTEGIAKDNPSPTEQSMNVQALLEAHSHEIKKALSDLESSHPLAADAITALDKKLDTVVTLMALDNLVDSKAAHSIQEASISACGIAFPVDEVLSPETKINLSLYLDTSGEQISAVGRVIDCQSLVEASTYYLRVEFVEMVDNEREKLIQHIIQRQGSLLKSLREQMDDDRV